MNIPLKFNLPCIKILSLIATRVLLKLQTHLPTYNNHLEGVNQNLKMLNYLIKTKKFWKLKENQLRVRIGLLLLCFTTNNLHKPNLVLLFLKIPLEVPMLTKQLQSTKENLRRVLLLILLLQIYLQWETPKESTTLKTKTYLHLTIIKPREAILVLIATNYNLIKLI